MENHPLVSGIGVGFVHPPRRERPVDADVRVVDRTTAGAELEVANVSGAGAGNGDDEVAKPVGAVRGGDVLGQRDDQIGRTQLPPGGGRRWWRQVRLVSMLAASGNPARERLDFAKREPAFAGKPASRGL